MIRPTRRAVMLFAASLPLTWLILYFYSMFWPLVLCTSVVMALVIALDAAFLLPRHLLEAEVRAPLVCLLGDVLDVEVVVRTPRHRRPMYVGIIIDLDSEEEPHACGRVLLHDGQQALCTLSLHPRLRGTLTIAQLTLHWRGRLGLVLHSRIKECRIEVKVLPNARSIESAAIEFFSRESLFGLKVQREKGSGTEFEALREYVAGMDSRFIDWKHSARHRALLCKEFRTERNHHIILGIDTGYLMQERIGDLTRLDHAIHAGLLLSWIALRGGDVVGSFAFDSTMRHFLPPERGTHTYAHMQHALAMLPYSQDETNFAMGMTELINRLKRRSLVVLMSEFVDTVTAELMIENLQQLARRHVVVFASLKDPYVEAMANQAPADLDAVARGVVAFEFMRERAGVLERMHRLGIHCIDVDAPAFSLALLNRYLVIKQRELV